MERAEFDKFAEEYNSLHRQNITSSGESPEYFAEYKIKDLKRIIRTASSSLETGYYLDFGAGVGSSIPFFRKHFPRAKLSCADVSENSLKIAASNYGNAAEFVTFDGNFLPFTDNTFDAAYASCVFHHIPVTEHIHLLQELRRVLKPKGVIMIYEHNPFNPLTVRAVSSCPFDENAILISAKTMKASLESAGFIFPSANYRVFIPKFLCKIRWIENWLKWLPLGAQYYVIASK
jgi:ubiquinone/menaquinone biosynthesis C-methylase UbiE